MGGGGCGDICDAAIHFTADGWCNPGCSVEMQSACNTCPNADKIWFT